MPYCYLCNAKIEKGEGVRKEVYTGHHKSGGFSSKRFWIGGRRYYGMRIVCQKCAKPSPFYNVFTVFAIVLILFVLWQLKGCFM